MWRRKIRKGLLNKLSLLGCCKSPEDRTLVSYWVPLIKRAGFSSPARNLRCRIHIYRLVLAGHSLKVTRKLAAGLGSHDKVVLKKTQGSWVEITFSNSRDNSLSPVSILRLIISKCSKSTLIFSPGLNHVKILHVLSVFI